MGKGSKPRPYSISKKEFDERYDQVFASVDVPKVDDGSPKISKDKWEKVQYPDVKISKPKKPFLGRVKGVLRKAIESPIVGVVIKLTPRPIRVVFSWLKMKLIDNDMIKDKKWYQSKTIWSAIIIALTAILQYAGLDFAGNPEVIQAAYEVIYVLAGAFGLVGLRSAIGEQITRKDN